MKKILSVVIMATLLLGVTGCSGATAVGATDTSSVELDTTSDTPSAGLATIVNEESFICAVTDKHTEDRTLGFDPIENDYYEKGKETYYYVTAIRDEDTALRFRTNEKFYNLCEFGTEFLITEQVIDRPLGGTETRYCYKGEVLDGATVIQKSEYEEPDLSEYEKTVGFAELVGVSSEFYHIVGFDEVERQYWCGRYVATEMQYYIIAKNADGNKLRFETDYDFWESSAVGDTLTIVAQQIDYAVSGVKTNYFLNGSRLHNVTHQKEG